jgi:ATP-binding cassette subfamily D (ALD) long-chain fatty acid import protein
LCQYLTVDIQQFSNKLAEIYSNIAKPVLDVMWVLSPASLMSTDDYSLYNYQLSRNVGAEGLVILTVLVQSSAGLRGSTKSYTD